MINYENFNNSSQFISYPDKHFNVYLLTASVSLFGKNTSKFSHNKILLNNLDTNSSAEIETYHTGIGIQCTDNNYPIEFSFDFDIDTGNILNSILPTKISEWKNSASVYIGNSIDRNYWRTSTFICNINNNDLTSLQKWILDVWIMNNKYYSLFSYIHPDQFNNGDFFNCYLSGSSCDLFVNNLINYLKILDININFVNPPYLNVMTIVTDVQNVYETNDYEISMYYNKLIDDLNRLYDYDNKINILDELLYVESNEKNVTNLFGDIISHLLKSTEPMIYYHQDKYIKIMNPKLWIGYKEIKLNQDKIIKTRNVGLNLDSINFSDYHQPTKSKLNLQQSKEYKFTELNDFLLHKKKPTSLLRPNQLNRKSSQSDIQHNLPDYVLEPLKSSPSNPFGGGTCPCNVKSTCNSSSAKCHKKNNNKNKVRTVLIVGLIIILVIVIVILILAYIYR